MGCIGVFKAREMKWLHDPLTTCRPI